MGFSLLGINCLLNFNQTMLLEKLSLSDSDFGCNFQSFLQPWWRYHSRCSHNGSGVLYAEKGGLEEDGYLYWNFPRLKPSNYYSGMLFHVLMGKKSCACVWADFMAHVLRSVYYCRAQRYRSLLYNLLRSMRWLHLKGFSLYRRVW